MWLTHSSCFILLFIGTVAVEDKDEQQSICSESMHIYCVSQDNFECLEVQQVFDDSYEHIYYLENQDTNCSSYIIKDDEVILRDLLMFTNSEVINVIGNSSTGHRVTVQCTENSGFLFENCHSIYLENLSMEGCSFNISNYIKPDIYPALSSYKSSITFQSVAFIRISNCLFENHIGFGTVIVDLLNTAVIEDCVFNGKESLIGTNESRSGGIFISQSQNFTRFHIRWCIFKGIVDKSTAHDRSNNAMLQNGGALDMHFTTTANSEGTILISDSNFQQNIALVGAAVHILLKGDVSNKISTIISNSNFSLNCAKISGGAVQLTNLQNGNRKTNLLLVKSCVFTNNNGSWGGGLAIYNLNSGVHFKITLEGSKWENNRASMSGFAVGVGGTEAYHTNPLSLHVRNCVFHSNSAISRDGTGAVAANSSEIVFDGGITTFTGSKQTALLLNGYSVAKFFAMVTFSNNFGIFGGAILLQFQSHIFIHSSSSIRFINNSASIMGGAIYSMVTGTKNCTFLFEENVGVANLSVYFHNNQVNQIQQAIFIQNAEGCASFKNILINGFKYYPATSNHVILPLKEVKFSLLMSSVNDGYTQVMPGQLFQLGVIEIRDFFGLKTNYSIDHAWITFINKNFEVRGPNTISLNTSSSKTMFFVEGPNLDQNVNESFDIHFFFYGTDTYRIGSTEITLEVAPCRIGYIYANKTKTCNCASTTSNIFSCSTNSQHLCVKYRYWFSDELNVAIPCPAQNCWYMYNQCPVTTTYCVNKTELFCGITHPDDLCWDGRSGLLCSQCASGYSFTFSAFQCANSTSCKPTNLALLMSALSLYWISYVLIILVVLSMNISIGSGFMYGIVYYFSVVTIYTKSNPLFSDLWLRIIVYVCIAITQLNPQLLGYTFRTCFIQNWDNPLPHELFQYTTPIFVVLFIIGIITVSKCCRLPKRISLSENSPIHAICMLILFSFTSLSLTSFNIIMPININGNLKVRIAPTIAYFSVEHVPYAVLALCIEVLLVLPTCIFFLFAPCISKYVNLVRFRLKPILDEFQACYRPECRWFAGFYFLARQFVYLVDGLLIEHIPQYNSMLLTLNILMLIIHVSFQPYQQKWINILDTLLLIDILVLSTYSAPLPNDQIFSVSRSLHNTVIPCALIIMPTVYLFGVLAFILFLQFKPYLVKYRCFNTMIRLTQTTNNSRHTESFPFNEDEWQRDLPFANKTVNQRNRTPKSISSAVKSNNNEENYGAMNSERSQNNINGDPRESNLRRFPPINYL